MAHKSYKKYAQNVVAQINGTPEEKRRIKEDIIEMLIENHQVIWKVIQRN